MRKFILSVCVGFLALGVVTALVSAGPFRSKWGGSVCGPGGCNVPDPEPAQAVAWQWKSLDYPNGANRVHLFNGNRYHGFWDAAQGYYLVYLGNEKWGDKLKAPPHPVPPSMLVKQDEKPIKLPRLEPWQLDGVKADEIEGQEETLYTLNGKPVSQLEADQKLLEDDSKKLWLIVNGTGRDQVVKDFLADPKNVDLVKRVRIWSVAADHFSMLDRDTKKPMFLNAGNPSITLMGADRKVLFEKDGYAGPDDLEAIRKADPEVKPAPLAPKKPDSAKPDGPPSPITPTPFNPIMPVCCVAAVVVGCLLMKRRSS
jgi:hypothetical protein